MKSRQVLEKNLQDELEKGPDVPRKVLLCTDFDGTLVHFTGLPSQTTLPDHTEELLTGLANIDQLHLAIISGRKFEELSQLVPIRGLTLAGNHGLHIRFDDGTFFEPNIAEDIKQTVGRLNRVVREKFEEKDGVILEDKNFGLAVHYRQYEGNEEEIKDEFYKIWRDFDCPSLEVIQGAKLVEVRPSNWNKGDAVRLLQEKWMGQLTIYIGDDTTDEDAFQVLQDQQTSFPVLVSQEENRDTNARYRLENPETVHNFLRDVYRLLST